MLTPSLPHAAESVTQDAIAACSKLSLDQGELPIPDESCVQKVLEGQHQGPYIYIGRPQSCGPGPNDTQVFVPGQAPMPPPPSMPPTEEAKKKKKKKKKKVPPPTTPPPTTKHRKSTPQMPPTFPPYSHLPGARRG